MAFLALVDAPLSSESMKFPVFSLLTGNFETETSSHVTAPSSGESSANLMVCVNATRAHVLTTRRRIVPAG